MKTVAVLVFIWSQNGAMQAVTIDMPTLAGCNAEVTRLGKALKLPSDGMMFCVEKK